MNNFVKIFLATILYTLFLQSLSAATIGFRYIAHIEEVTISGKLPAEILPVKPGNAVLGSFYFDTAITDSNPRSDVGGYVYDPPGETGVHFLKFQLPGRPPEAGFNLASFGIFNDSSGFVPPGEKMDRFYAHAVSPIFLPGFPKIEFPIAFEAQVELLLQNLGPIDIPLGPFDSVNFPTKLPKLTDFDTKLWHFAMSPLFTIPDWSIDLRGRIVLLEAAAAPEPATIWLFFLGVIALLISRIQFRSATLSGELV